MKHIEVVSLAITSIATFIIISVIGAKIEGKYNIKYLTDKFGDKYIQYKARTGMFLPKIGKAL
jgi:protein-S-isoprenylcysteine O-methyltransferase Ste14